jgi:DNA-binding response OmpR family regulator
VRVLVVEDERRLADGIRAGLEAEGFAVDVAHDGLDGLWLARERDYDAIVLDLMLPGMNGYRVCATLRAESVWAPILVLTAKDGEWDEVEALDTGADDFLTKPFSHAVLLARLRAMMRRHPRTRPVTLAAGDLRVDLAQRRAWRGEQPIELTPNELSILEYLLRRAGEIVSKRDVLDHVWDDSFEGRSQHRRGVRGPVARQDRPAVRARGHRDRARCRLPAGQRWGLSPCPDAGAAASPGCARCGCAPRSSPPWWWP